MRVGDLRAAFERRGKERTKDEGEEQEKEKDEEEEKE